MRQANELAWAKFFGATVVFRVDAPDGAVVARIAIDSAQFWLADESPEHHNFSPETLQGATTRLILTTDDPDAVFARAVAAGATVVHNVENNYGWRLGRVLDPYGHPWEIGKPLESASGKRSLQKNTQQRKRATG